MPQCFFYGVSLFLVHQAESGCFWGHNMDNNAQDGYCCECEWYDLFNFRWNFLTLPLNQRFYPCKFIIIFMPYFCFMSQCTNEDSFCEFAHNLIMMQFLCQCVMEIRLWIFLWLLGSYKYYLQVGCWHFHRSNGAYRIKDSLHFDNL